MASCMTIPNMGNSLLGGQRLFWCQTRKTISTDRKSSEAMSLAGMYANFGNCEAKPEKFRPSTLTNLATKATDVGSSSFVASNVPVINKLTMK